MVEFKKSLLKTPMYCIQCGSPANYAIPKGDSRERLVCSQCGYVHYDNPKLVCGTLCVHDGKILLCRRAIEPRYGFWTLPAGFMEIGESMADGAVRETLEEADGIAINTKLYAVFDLPHLGQIHVMYLARLDGGRFGVGSESLECRLFAPDELPWDELSFRTVEMTLRCYVDDLGRCGDGFDAYPLHQIVLDDKPF